MQSDISGAIAAPTTVANDNPAVLVIEEDPALLRSLAAFLQAHRISVATACNGAKGLELFRRMSPAVVLTDLVNNGVGTIVQMRRERSEVKIIAMSGDGRIGRLGLLEIAKGMGADATLKKPFGAWDLAATICGMLEFPPARPQSFNWLTCGQWLCVDGYCRTGL